MEHGLFVAKVVKIDERHVLTASGDHGLRVWRVGDMSLVGTLMTHKEDVLDVVLVTSVVGETRAGRVRKRMKFASVSYDNTIALIEVVVLTFGDESRCSPPVLLHKFDARYITRCVSLAGGSVLAGTSYDGFVQLFDVASEVFHAENKFASVLQAPQRLFGRASSSDSAESEFSKARLALRFTNNTPFCISTLPNPDLIAVGYRKGDLVVWNWRTGNMESHVKAHDFDVTGVAALSSGRIVSVSLDRSLRVWRGTRCVQIVRYANPLTCVEARGSTLCVVGSKTGDVFVSNDAEGVTFRTIAAHQKSVVRSLALLSALDTGDYDVDENRFRLVSASNDRTCKVWSFSGDETADHAIQRVVSFLDRNAPVFSMEADRIDAYGNVASSVPCSICLEPLEGSKCRTLPCQHIYHEACFRRWTEHSVRTARVEVRCPVDNKSLLEHNRTSTCVQAVHHPAAMGQDWAFSHPARPTVV